MDGRQIQFRCSASPAATGGPRYAWSGSSCSAALDADARAVSPTSHSGTSIKSPTTEAMCTFEEEMKSRLAAIETKLDKMALSVAKNGDHFRGRDLLGGARHSQCSKPFHGAKAQADDVLDAAIVCVPGSVNDDEDSRRCLPINDSATSAETRTTSRRRRRPRMRGISGSRNLPSADLKRQATWIREQVHRPGHNAVQRFGKQFGVSVGVGTRALDSAQNRPLWRFVQGNKFHAVASTMIVLNVVFIGVMTHVQLQNTFTRVPRHSIWNAIEVCFCAYFFIEIMIRVAAERFLFLYGPYWQWNFLDTLLVILSVTDILLNFSGTSVAKNLNVARMLRFARFFRLISLARAMRPFQQLRLVVFTICESISSLFWCFFILGLILYTFAVLIVQVVVEHIQLNPAANTHAAVLELYGGVPMAMNTLFMTISGGIDWRDAMIPLKEIHWTYKWAFTFYIFFMVIGVLNVVVGAFVARTGEIASRDREYLVRAQMSELNIYFNKVRTFFKEADKDKSGMLSIEEFRQTLKHPEVQAYFSALDLDVSQAELLFALLDQDRSEMVSLDEFLAGCMRLRGQAKSIDVNMLLHANRRLFNRISHLMEVIAEAFDSDDESMGSHAFAQYRTALPSDQKDDMNGPG